MTPTPDASSSGARYRGEWRQWSDVAADYPDAPGDDALVYAEYDSPPYEGRALVVWIDADGTWWENNDDHCSCHGLDHWEPERTSPEALLTRQGWEGLHEAVARRRHGHIHDRAAV